LLDLKKRLGYDDPRFKSEDCDLCGNNIIQRGYTEFEPQPRAFAREPAGCAVPGTNGHAASEPNLDDLVKKITDQVMAGLSS
jgi:L-fuculose-phosphate aldolase